MLLDFTLKQHPKMGRGLFATRPIKEGRLICQCPLLTVPQQHAESIKQTSVVDYTFNVDDTLVIPLGYGALFNHSFDHNVAWEPVEDDMFEFIAVRDIDPDEQLFINYGYQPENKSLERANVINHKPSRRQARILANNATLDLPLLERIRDWASTKHSPWKLETLMKVLKLTTPPTAELRYLVQDEYLSLIGDAYVWIG
jgi:hypothetical protein